mgnify:CR=1 FL=1
MASAAADLQDFSQVFYEQLKCHICESRLNAGEDRWYQCNYFHWICHDCKNRTCCRYSIGGDCCKLIEAALNVGTMRFKCENLSRGCKETSDKEGMIFHQTECINRLVYCPCHALMLQFHELIDHMMKQYIDIAPIINGIFGQKIELKANLEATKSTEPRILEIGQNVFLEMKAFMKSGHFVHWIYLIGSPSEARKVHRLIHTLN